MIPGTISTEEIPPSQPLQFTVTVAASSWAQMRQYSAKGVRAWIASSSSPFLVAYDSSNATQGNLTAWPSFTEYDRDTQPAELWFGNPGSASITILVEVWY